MMRKAAVLIIITLLTLVAISALATAAPAVETRAPVPTYTTTGLKRDLVMDDLVGTAGGIVTGGSGEYEVNGHIVVDWGYSLTIQPGDHLIIAGECNLTIKGSLRCVGTSVDNRDILLEKNSTYIEPWGGINFDHTAFSAGCFVNNTHIKGALSGFRCYANSPTIVGNLVEGSTRSGVDCYTASPVVKNNVFKDCLYGAFVDESSVPDFTGNTIEGCSDGVRCYSDSFVLQDNTIADCTTNGIASYQNSGTFRDNTISGCKYGMFLSNSNNTIEDMTFSGNDIGLYIAWNSAATIDGCTIGDSTGTGIVVDSADLMMNDTTISNNINEGLEIRSSAGGSKVSSVVIYDTDFTHNGYKRSGAWRNYSAIYARHSELEMSGCNILEAAYTALEMYNMSAVVEDTTIDDIDKFNFDLGGKTLLQLVNVSHDPDRGVYFRDQYSKVEVGWHVDLRLVDYQTQDLVQNANMKLVSTSGDVVHDGLVVDGTLSDLMLIQYNLTDYGTLFHTPHYFTVEKSGYGQTIYSYKIEKDQTIELELRPPNVAPVVQVTTDLTGPISTETYVLGTATDDFEVKGVEYAIDGGAWMNATGTSSFQITLDPTKLLPTTHTLSVRAHDGMEYSTIVNVTFRVQGVSGIDTDNDGLLDILEDINGNGVVDTGETDPNDPDTDGDGIEDGVEVDNSDGSSTDPLEPDTDGDTINDGVEDANQDGRKDKDETDPTLKDTDGDGHDDNEDAYPNDEDKWKESSGDSEFDPIVMIAILVILILIVVVILLVRFRSQKDEDLDPDDFGDGKIKIHPWQSSKDCDCPDCKDKKKKDCEGKKEKPKVKKGKKSTEDEPKKGKSRKPKKLDDEDKPKIQSSQKASRTSRDKSLKEKGKKAKKDF